MYALRLWSVRRARLLQRVYSLFARSLRVLAPLLRILGPGKTGTLLVPVERGIKGMLFDCQMCGQCVLSVTGMACPMNCPKEMRNGPCGGVRPDGTCEVRPEMRCVWLEATAGMKRIDPGIGLHPPSLLPPLDQRRRGNSSWVQIIAGHRDPVLMPPVVAPVEADNPDFGSFEQILRRGQMAVTVELAPPDSADPAALLERADKFRGLVDAINITDGAGGNCHMSSVAASALLAGEQHTPIYQVVCRDRNRIAIQGDLLGAAALGVKNILCLTGDDVTQGDHPEAKRVFDLDAVSLLHIARRMCDHGEFDSGRKLEAAPKLFIGATINPFVPPYADRIINMEKKILCGARFIQTQFCFDVGLFESFMREVRRRDLHTRAHILVGVGTLSSARALAWMAANVPGVHIPVTFIERIAKAPDQRQAASQACLEIIRAVTQIEGVAGIHVMGHRNEDTLAEIIRDSGLRALPELQTTPYAITGDTA